MTVHERRANDFGFLAGGGIFMTVTPVWWLAARAGLLPQPDAMVLWCVFMGGTSIGWFWHRYRCAPAELEIDMRYSVTQRALLLAMLAAQPSQWADSGNPARP